MDSQTTLARIQLARRNEELVFARSSREGQMFFSWVRVFVVLLFGASQQIVARLAGAHVISDPLRGWVSFLYVAFCVGLYVYLRRMPDERDSRTGAVLGQAARACVDYAFLIFQAWRGSALDGSSHPEMGVAIIAVFLCFSVASFNGVVVALNAALAIASYTVMAVVTRAAFDVPSYCFVVAAFVSIAVVSGSVANYIRGMFLDLRKRDNLTRFLAPQVAEHVMRFGDDALAPTQREATVLFTDIRDFTSLSEGLQPREVLELLDELLGHLSQIVKGHDGIVNKFLGDGMLAFWNVPDRREKHAELALKAALDMRRKLEELNAHRALLGRPTLRIGIGVHSGPVAAGMLGGADQHEYTIIGDAVNVASRIEGLNKKLGTDILVSESTWLLTGGRFRGRRAAEEQVKGREQPVVVYALEEREAPGSPPPVAAGA